MPRPNPRHGPEPTGLVLWRWRASVSGLIALLAAVGGCGADAVVEPAPSAATATDPSADVRTGTGAPSDAPAAPSLLDAASRGPMGPPPTAAPCRPSDAGCLDTASVPGDPTDPAGSAPSPSPQPPSPSRPSPPSAGSGSEAPPPSGTPERSASNPSDPPSSSEFDPTGASEPPEGSSTEPADSDSSEPQPAESRSSLPSSNASAPSSPPSSAASESAVPTGPPSTSTPPTDSGPSSPPTATEPGETLFEEISLPGLEHVRMHPGAFDGSNVGTGAALVDLDGDGRLDLFFGADGGGLHDACVYLNRSTPDAPRFEALDGVCGLLPRVVTAMTDPRPAPGGQGLLLAGTNTAHHLALDAEGAPSLRTLFTLPDIEAFPEQACVPASLLIADLALDGTPYLLIGCRAGAQSRLLDSTMNANNRALRLDSGSETLIDAPGSAPWLADGGSTLALAQVDIRDDGLPDILLINDTFSTLNNRNTVYSPGGALLRCPPAADCGWESVRIARDNTAWGSLMGAGELRVGPSRFWYLTDWGPNRLLRWTGDHFVDEAAQRGVLLDRDGPFLVFGWSALVDDFNGNGRDDLLVTNGSPRASHIDDPQHRDFVLLQRDDGTFEALGASAGLPPPSAERSTLPGFLNSSRGAMKADLTGDGHLNVIILDDRGAPRFFRERRDPALPPRCNVDPFARYTTGVGTGLSFAAEGSRDFRTWDIQGQMLFGAPSRILLPHQRGVLRFQSGAEIPYDCGGTPGPIAVHEPEWLQLMRTPEGVLVSADAPWLFADDDATVTVSVHALADDPDDPFALILLDERETTIGAEALATGWAAPIAPDADTVMVRFGDRWVPHRFRLSALPLAP